MVHVSDTHISVQLAPKKKPTQIILRKDPPKEYCPWRKITKHGSAVDSHDDIFVKEKKKKKKNTKGKGGAINLD